MKKAKIWIQLAVGLLIAGGVMWGSGILHMTDNADVIMTISDGFTVAAVLYLGIGALMWISTTGFFDIFGFAFKKGAHALVPFMVEDPQSDYYEYKMKKEGKRKGFTEHGALWIGLIFLLVAIVFTAWWYAIA